jgi:hypothetical protein
MRGKPQQRGSLPIAAEFLSWSPIKNQFQIDFNWSF